MISGVTEGRAEMSAAIAEGSDRKLREYAYGVTRITATEESSCPGTLAGLIGYMDQSHSFQHVS